MKENEKDYQYRHVSNVDKKGNRTDVTNTNVEFADDDLIKVTGADNKTKKRVNVTDGLNRYKVKDNPNRKKGNY